MTKDNELFFVTPVLTIQCFMYGTHIIQTFGIIFRSVVSRKCFVSQYDLILLGVLLVMFKFTNQLKSNNCFWFSLAVDIIMPSDVLSCDNIVLLFEKEIFHVCSCYLT